MSNCLNCGAVKHSNMCSYCGAISKESFQYTKNNTSICTKLKKGVYQKKRELKFIFMIICLGSFWFLDGFNWFITLSNWIDSMVESPDAGMRFSTYIYFIIIAFYLFIKILKEAKDTIEEITVGTLAFGVLLSLASPFSLVLLLPLAIAPYIDKCLNKSVYKFKTTDR